MTSGWFTYSLVELKQRYRIEGPISSNIDEALSDYHCEIRDGFYIFWGRHKCQVNFVLYLCAYVFGSCAHVHAPMWLNFFL